MPVSFLVLLVLFLGQSVILPWVQEPVEAKQAWLNTPFLVARQGAGFLVLSGLSLLYVLLVGAPGYRPASRIGNRGPRIPGPAPGARLAGIEH